MNLKIYSFLNSLPAAAAATLTEASSSRLDFQIIVNAVLEKIRLVTFKKESMGGGNSNIGTYMIHIHIPKLSSQVLMFYIEEQCTCTF